MSGIMIIIVPLFAWIALEALGFTLNLIMKKNTGAEASTLQKVIMTLVIMVPLIYFVGKAGL